MSEIIKWRLWVTGTNNYLATDDKSEIALTSLEEGLRVVESPAWVPLDVVVLGKKRVQWKDGAISQAEVFPFQLQLYGYDTDNTDIDALDAILRHRFVYLCRDGNEQTESSKYPVTFHSANKCVQVVIEENDADYIPEQGSIDKKLQFRRHKPLF